MSIHINHPDNPAPANEQTWTTEEMQKEFDVTGFAAGFVFVSRRADGTSGTLQFNGNPRVYHSLQTY